MSEKMAFGAATGCFLDTDGGVLPLKARAPLNDMPRSSSFAASDFDDGILFERDGAVERVIRLIRGVCLCFLVGESAFVGMNS